MNGEKYLDKKEL